MKFYQLKNDIFCTHDMDTIYRFEIAEGRWSENSPYEVWLSNRMEKYEFKELPESMETIMLLLRKGHRVFAAALYKDIYGGSLTDARIAVDRLSEGM